MESVSWVNCGIGLVQPKQSKRFTVSITEQQYKMLQYMALDGSEAFSPAEIAAKFITEGIKRHPLFIEYLRKANSDSPDK